MISWRLWYALHHPPYRHILFQQMVASRLRDVYWPKPQRGIQPLWATVILAVFACLLGLTPILITGVYIFLFIFLPLSIGLLLFNGFVYGAVLTARVSQAVATHAGRGRFELVALAPPGAMGMTWLIAIASIYRSGRPIGINYDHAWYLRAFLLLIFTVVLVSSFGDTWDKNAQVVILATYVLTQALAFQVDDMHAVTSGVVIGLAAATWLPRPLAARTVALVAYMALHMLFYPLAAVMILVVLPRVWPSDAGWLAALALPCWRLAVFYALREGVISAVWQVLTRRLNAQPGDLRSLTW